MLLGVGRVKKMADEDFQVSALGKSPTEIYRQTIMASIFGVIFGMETLLFSPALRKGLS